MIKKINIIKYGKKFLNVNDENGELISHEKIRLIVTFLQKKYLKYIQ